MKIARTIATALMLVAGLAAGQRAQQSPPVAWAPDQEVWAQVEPEHVVLLRRN